MKRTVRWNQFCTKQVRKSSLLVWRRQVAIFVEETFSSLLNAHAEEAG